MPFYAPARRVPLFVPPLLPDKFESKPIVLRFRRFDDGQSVSVFTATEGLFAHVISRAKHGHLAIDNGLDIRVTIRLADFSKIRRTVRLDRSVVFRLRRKGDTDAFNCSVAAVRDTDVQITATRE